MSGPPISPASRREPASQRDEIAESWRRTELAGLDPASALTRITYGAVDAADRLLAAAAPVLEDLDARLAGTRISTMLLDADGRVVTRSCGDQRVLRAFDHVGVDVGASLLEESVGTTAPGVVLETRTGVSVHGEEHFAVALRPFSCYAQPVIHPTTRRVEGVLDVTTLATEANPLLVPLVARAVADIEQRLLDGARIADRELLAAFQAAGRRRPLVAVGHDLLMSNEAALDLLDATDLAVLRGMAADAGDGSRTPLVLASGREVRVHASRVGGSRGGALLAVEAPGENRQRTRRLGRRTTGPAARPAAAAGPTGAAPVLVSGPPGSGRTTRAHELAEAPTSVLSSADALVGSVSAWARSFDVLVRSGRGTVVVDGADLLPPPLTDLVRRHLARAVAPRVVLVTGPVEELEGRAAALAGLCTRREQLLPLAGRRHDLPRLAGSLLRELGADPSLHLTPGALRALTAQEWPGNLVELRAVLAHVLERRSTGGVVVDDLPEGHRSHDPVRPLGAMERAERDAVVGALRAHGGNKVRAAADLGISRTTLYAKIRALRIAE